VSRPAIVVEDLGKRYRIGGRTGASSFRGALKERFGRSRSTSEDAPPDHIWAVRNISFEAPLGQVTGIIGRNGAGKSTLLKILSRITRPTEGRAEVWGTVGSLLEVGTGFHPELSGRENVYLNGSILGMGRREIDRKFDEIIAFAETEAFVDTPVKHYSSGMHVRLAFAVAAHLEPEILIIDEVLAVGDINFQKRCIGKMHEVAGDGRTVLFVSHNLHAITGLCDQVLWVDEGRIRSMGPAKEQVSLYSAAALPLATKTTDPGRDKPLILSNVRLVAANGEEREDFDLFEGLSIRFDVAQTSVHKRVRFVIRIRSTEDDAVVLATTSWDSEDTYQPEGPGAFTVSCTVPPNFLNAGTYSVSVGADVPRGPAFAQLEDVRRFVIVNTASFGDGLFGARDGYLSPYQQWNITSADTDN